MKLLDFFLRAPWTYGLECQVCRMTFKDAKSHQDYAEKNKTLKMHEGKIPILRR